MKVLAVAITHRTLGSIQPVLDRIAADGGRVELARIPTKPQLPGQTPAEMGMRPILATKGEDCAKLPLSDPFWHSLTEVVQDFKPDVIYCDDLTNWPTAHTFSVVSTLESRPLVVACQHGIFQTWHAMDREFNCDYFFCYGTQHVYNFSVSHWPRVLPVGLAKLDCLRDVETRDDGFVLYIAQEAPRPAIVSAMLSEFSEIVELPVKIRPHPAHVEVYTGLDDKFEILDPTSDPIAAIARCTIVVTTHSTAMLEAMLLGKDVVVVPSFGLTDFALLPFVARDFTGRKLRVALGQVRRRKEEIKRFVDVTCGGRNYDATDRAYRALQALVCRPAEYKSMPGADDWWKSDTPLARVVGGHHPLCGARHLLL